MLAFYVKPWFKIGLIYIARRGCCPWAVLVGSVREGCDAVGETVPDQVAQLHELETERWQGVDTRG